MHFFFSFNFFLPDPYFDCWSGRENKCGFGFRRENECGSGSTAWWCDTLFHTKRPLKGQIFLSKERHAKPAFRAKIFAFQGNLWLKNDILIRNYELFRFTSWTVCTPCKKPKLLQNNIFSWLVKIVKNVPKRDFVFL